MEHCYKYSVVKFAANRLRDERLNVAIVVFKGDELDVRLPKSLDKLHAISAALDVQSVRDAVENLSDLYSFVISETAVGEERLDALASIAPVDFSPTSEFFAASKDDYDRCLDRLLHTLVEPEPKPIRAVRRRPTRLLSDVKSAFKAERVLARKGEGLEAHRIVLNYKIAEGLPADLLLKNGAMHVVETADASGGEQFSMRTIYSIAKSALVFEQARMQFGEHDARASLIYKASSALEGFISPALEAAEHQGAKLVNWESRDDRVRFIVELSSLAEPLADVSGNTLKGVHASVQPKFRLN